VKDFDDRFALIEKRLRALLSENKSLAARVNELERELAQARNEAREQGQFHDTKLHVRKKIESILHALEDAGLKK
jgi:cell division septum initiation protein DivIVA